MAGSFVEGNDDTFVVMLFAFVATICCLLLVEFFFRYRVYAADLATSTMFLKQTLGLVTTQPAKLRLGYETLKSNPAYTKKHIVPLWRRVLGRWRWVMWVSCIFLFSVVAYQKLSFDPHAILGVPTTASMKEIKTAFRKHTRALHPDVNKTEEARPLYAKVKKAYKYLQNPDEAPDARDTDGTEDHRPKVALPTFITDPNYALYSMTLLLLLLFSAPFYLLFWLTSKDSSSNVIPLMKSIANNMVMVEPFFDMVGQPKNPDHEVEAKERVKVLALIKKVQSEGGFEQPRDEVPIPPVDICTHFRPDISSYAEMWQLLNDVTAQGVKATTVKESDNKLRDNNIFVNRDRSPVVQNVLQKAAPSQEDTAAMEALKERKAKSNVEGMGFRVPSADEEAVGNYFLRPLLDMVLKEIYMVYPRQEGSTKDMVYKLHTIYNNRFDHLAHMKKYAAEKNLTEFDASNKVQTEMLAKALSLQVQSERFTFELVAEMKNRTKAAMKAYQARVNGDTKKSKKNK